MATIDRGNANLSALSGSLVLIGAGKMGGAMLQGWLGLGFDPGKAVVFEPQPSDEIAGLVARGVRLNPKEPVRDAAAMVIAVKPQVAADVIPAHAGLAGPQTVSVSIMAGQTLQTLGRLLSPETAIVRAMPNTPAAIGRGITVAVANPRVSVAQRDLADHLLAAVGAVEWVADETLMDAVTAVSGSGPAYVFLLAEAMEEAGVAAGLPRELAAQLARETVAGAGELLHRSSDLEPAVLRKNVTSPGGTTAAALEVLMSGSGLTSLMTQAVAAATRRSRELAG